MWFGIALEPLSEYRTQSLAFALVKKHAAKSLPKTTQSISVLSVVHQKVWDITTTHTHLYSLSLCRSNCIHLLGHTPPTCVRAGHVYFLVGWIVIVQYVFLSLSMGEDESETHPGEGGRCLLRRHAKRYSRKRSRSECEYKRECSRLSVCEHRNLTTTHHHQIHTPQHAHIIRVRYTLCIISH